MNSLINIGLSGLNAAQTRMRNAASNIANAQSFGVTFTNGDSIDAYTPVDTVNQATPDGGVDAITRPRVPATLTLYDATLTSTGTDGTINYPNVSLAEEIVSLKLAEHAYKANALVIKTAAETEKSLLDSLA